MSAGPDRGGDRPLDNALHSCSPGDEVHLQASSMGRNGQIVVADGGRGFDPVLAEAVFERFRRLEPHQRSGTGVGLTVCRALVAAQGGTLVASSPGPDGDARFTVTLPTGGLPAGSLPTGQAG